MKYFSFLLLSVGITCITAGCKTKKGIHPISENEINELYLKRGEVISCGPPQAEFGKINFPESCQPETQQDFDLAIALLHSFEYDEAEKTFARVIDKDPKCAMAYWGVAMSNYHPLWAPPTQEELVKGSKAIAIAQSLGSNSKTETGYINSLTVFYKDYATIDHKSRGRNYKDAIEKIYLADTANKELTIFYCLALIATADPTDKTYSNQKKAGTILEKLYPEGQNHPGIIHYIIHTYDSPELASLGLVAARRYATVAPSSAHAQHMPSHIFTRLGLWDEDIQSNLAAASSAKCYAEAAKLNGHWSEELHALDYLMYSYLQKGDNVSAKKELDYVNSMTKAIGVMNAHAYAFAAIPSRYALENKLWKDAAALTHHPALGDSWKKFVWQASIVHFAKLMGCVHTHNIELAKTELQTLYTIYDTLMGRKDNYSANQVMIQIKSGSAWIALKEGKTGEAIQLQKEAMDLEEKTGKHPVTPGEVLPTQQLLADMFIELKKYPEALAAYQEDLRIHPNRFNSIYGAAYSSEKIGDKAGAKKYYQQLLAIANSPTSNRAELQVAKAFVKTL